MHVGTSAQRISVFADVRNYTISCAQTSSPYQAIGTPNYRRGWSTSISNKQCDRRSNLILALYLWLISCVAFNVALVGQSPGLSPNYESAVLAGRPIFAFYLQASCHALTITRSRMRRAFSPLRHMLQGFVPRSPNFLWQRTTTVTVNWFAGGAWKNNTKRYNLTPELLYNFLQYIHSLQMWPRASYYNFAGRGLDTHVIVRKHCKVSVRN